MRHIDICPSCASSGPLKRFVLPAIIVTLVPLLFVEPHVARWLESNRTTKRHGEIIHEITSTYSHIRVRERGNVRCLTFVDPNGREERQSAIDIKNPHAMQLGYTTSFFASLLFREPQERVLIVGLGGGGMVRFLNHAFPETMVEAVEIDRVVVGVAKNYFGTMEGPMTKIHVADAFDYLKEPHGPFDALYMDAFLRPSVDSGLENVTQRLKTLEFLQSLRRQLNPGGIVAFNLHQHASSTQDDLDTLKTAFPQVYLFGVPRTGNLIAICTIDRQRLTTETLTKRAANLETNLDVGLPWQSFVNELQHL
jgi:spermidine synthase